MLAMEQPTVLPMSYLRPGMHIRTETDEVVDIHGVLHTHEFYELVVVAKGIIAHVINGRSGILVPGDAFCMAPGEIHAYHRPVNALIYNCMFSREIFAPEMSEVGDLPVVGSVLNGKKDAGYAKVHLTPARTAAVMALLGGMMDEESSDRSGGILAIKGRLFQVLVEVSRGFDTNAADLRNHYSAYTHKVMGVTEEIHDNIGRELRVCDLAQRMGVSEEHFSRLFKGIYGLSPLAYIKHLKVSKAMNLLASTDWPMERIGSECGVYDQAYFSRIFRKTVGMSPRDYRRSVQGIGVFPRA